jgi:hypothetical protein
MTALCDYLTSQELQRQLYIAKKDEDGGGDQEAALRELYLTQLQCYARESMDELDMIQQVLCADLVPLPCLLYVRPI